MIMSTMPTGHGFLAWANSTVAGPIHPNAHERFFAKLPGRADGAKLLATENCAYYFFADSISLMSCSVTCGSNPSVWPFSIRTTSATTRPSLQFGYTYTCAVPGRGSSPQAAFGGFCRELS